MGVTINICCLYINKENNVFSTSQYHQLHTLKRVIVVFSVLEYVLKAWKDDLINSFPCKNINCCVGVTINFFYKISRCINIKTDKCHWARNKSWMSKNEQITFVEWKKESWRIRLQGIKRQFKLLFSPLRASAVTNGNSEYLKHSKQFLPVTYFSVHS